MPEILSPFTCAPRACPISCFNAPNESQMLPLFPVPNSNLILTFLPSWCIRIVPALEGAAVGYVRGKEGETDLFLATKLRVHERSHLLSKR